MAKKTKSKSSRKKATKKKKLSFKFWRDISNWKLLLPIAILTFIAFSPSLQNGFVNWDDDKNFLENANVRDINQHNIGTQITKIFDPFNLEESSVIGNYNPLPIATFALEQLFFGFENPLPWHLNNILLHIICTLLVFRLMDLLKVKKSTTIIITLLFAIHPLRVESVAWVTERKDVLFGAFYLGALVNYVKYHESKMQKKYLVWVYLLFALSLLSKIQAVTLPLSMLCIDYWRGRDIKWKLIIEKTPYFLMSLGIGLLGIKALEAQGSLESNATYAMWQRLFIGSYSFLIFIVKSLVPYKMVPLYPYPETMPWFMYASMALVPLYLGGFYLAWKKNLKYVVFGMAFFTFNIFFLLQILGAGQGFLADRFTYIAYIGLFFIIAHGYDLLAAKLSLKPLIRNGIIAAITLAFSFLTFQQNKIWKNSDTLWTHVLKYHKNITVAWGNRANYYRDTGQTEKALSDYTERIRLKPNDGGAYNSRGKLYFNSTDRRQWPLAKADYEKASQLEPDNAEYLTNLGAIFAKMGDGSNALRNFSVAIQKNPNHAVAYLNRSIIYQQQGRFQEALSDIQMYIKFNPYNPDLWYESGKLKRVLGDPNGGLSDLNTAMKYNPNKGIYYYERSKVYYDLGNINNARTDYQNAFSRGYTGDSNYVNLLK